MMDWASQFGMKVPMHFGAPSYPGSVRFWADEVIQYQPDVVVHLNGGPVTAPLKEIDKVLERTDAIVEITLWKHQCFTTYCRSATRHEKFETLDHWLGHACRPWSHSSRYPEDDRSDLPVGWDQRSRRNCISNGKFGSGLWVEEYRHDQGWLHSRYSRCGLSTGFCG